MPKRSCTTALFVSDVKLAIAGCAGAVGTSLQRGRSRRSRRISAHKLTAVENTRGAIFPAAVHELCTAPHAPPYAPSGRAKRHRWGRSPRRGQIAWGCRYLHGGLPVPGAHLTNGTAAFRKMRKCNMCYERQSAGKLTACAEACPVGATINGNRDELDFRKPSGRIAEKAQTSTTKKFYGNPSEVGGTSVFLPFGRAI